MSVGYTWVQWNRHKKVYDCVVAAGVAVYLALFIIVGKLAYRGTEAVSDEILVLRALGSCAFLMLQFVLMIGPLARLDRRWLPILYNRRHLGVATFCVAFLHGALAVGYYHGFGVVHPFVSLLTSNTNFDSLGAFPFQIPGLLALIVLFLMAATSHDFWLKNLGQNVWKRMHMLVYVAYALVVMHVALGALQSQRNPFLAAGVLVAAGVVVGLHGYTGRREVSRDEASDPAPIDDAPWIDAGAASELVESRGRVVCVPGGERIALFRHQGAVSAITNVCAHQGGPLGEGRILDGCVTCPWHGWQYLPHNGQSPPPFTERISTYCVRIRDGRIQVDPRPLPPGTPVEPARIEEGGA